MKKTNTLYLVVFLILIPSILLANKWNTPSNGWFKTEYNGIDNMYSGNTKSLASISFQGQIWNFVNYQDGHGKIALRKLTNTPTSSSAVDWKLEKKINGPANLTDLGTFEWQPAPVVFNNVLYLFVGDTRNGISYSTYNVGDSSWSATKEIPGDFSNTGGKKLGYGMAAVVVGNRLCLVTQNYWGFIQFFTTADTTLELNNWTYFHDTAHSGLITNSGAADINYGAVSAFSRNYIENGVGKSKLMYAFIDDRKYPRAIECSFDTKGDYSLISDATISSERHYQSVAIVEGTVTGDPNSSGHCVQAFLKLDNMDNGYQRFRIQRYQSQENAAWVQRENNLVPQNYLWASRRFNLNAINFAVAVDNQNLRQYMNLFYVTYNDWDHPMSCAWVETDRLVYDPNKEMSNPIAGANNTQYIGYIEGPPPFHLNNLGHNGTNPESDYLNPELNPISEVNFSTTNTQGQQSQIGYGVGGDVKVNAAFVKAGLSAAFGQAWDSEFTKSTTHEISMKAKADHKGVYITFAPKISRAFYWIKDVQGRVIDSTYNYYMMAPTYKLEIVDLEQGLNPADPATYYNRAGINFPAFHTTEYGTTNYSYDPPVGSGVKLGMKSSNSQSNTIKGKINIGVGLGEMFDVGFDGSFDYSLKTTTDVSCYVFCTTVLNEAEDSTDVVRIDYNIYWINPVDGVNNWWLHEDALDQNTWCFTYEVTYVEYQDGSSIGIRSNTEPGAADSDEMESIPENEPEEQLEPSQFSLAQNYPNPFKPYTVIKYQIGFEDLQYGTDNQGYQTKLVVYNLSGHQVASIVDEWKASGSYEVEFDASQLVPGIYFYSLQSGNFKAIKKLILLK